jgi:hypothetical protein
MSKVEVPADRAASPPNTPQLLASAISSQTIIAALLGAAVVALIWLATAWSASNSSSHSEKSVIHSEKSVIRSEKGELKVQYMVQDTPTSASGSTMENVSVIEFHPNFVVVRRKDGSGRVFFSERTRELSWSP